MSCLVDANHRMVDVLTFDESLCGDETSCRFSSLLSSWARNGSEALRLRSAVDSLGMFFTTFVLLRSFIFSIYLCE